MCLTIYVNLITTLAVVFATEQSYMRMLIFVICCSLSHLLYKGRWTNARFIPKGPRALIVSGIYFPRQALRQGNSFLWFVFQARRVVTSKKESFKSQRTNFSKEKHETQIVQQTVT